MDNQKKDSILEINDIKSLWRAFIKNWYIILSCVLVSYVGAYFYTYKLTDIYAASMQILLKSNDAYDYQSLIQTGGGGMGYGFGGGGGVKDYTENYNAMRVMKSFDLLKKTVDKLGIDVSYYIKGRLRTNELYYNIPYKITLGTVNPLLYEQMMKFKIIDQSKYSITYEKGNNEYVREGYFNRPLITTDFKIDVFKNNVINVHTTEKLSKIDYIVQFHDRATQVLKYQNALTLEIPEYSGIIQATVEDVIPQRAVTFLDTLGKVYNDNTLITKLEINARTLSFIEKQLTELTQMMTETEDKLQNYKEKEAILDLDKEEENYFEQMVNTQTDADKVALTLTSLNAIEKYIIEDKGPDLAPPTIFSGEDDVYITNCVTNLFNAQLERSGEGYSSSASSSNIKELDRKIDYMKKNLLEYINTSKKAVITQKKVLDDKIETYQLSISNIPIKQRQLLNIQRNLEVNEKMYSFLLERKAENTIARASIVPDSKVIESARSVGIIKPNKSNIIYSFIGAGFIISFLLIFIRTVFYETIDNIDELKLKTFNPVLGEIIQTEMHRYSDIASISNDPRSAVIESFRTVRTNLQFMTTDDGGSKIYLLTSNHPGEGKTFCTVNLASLLAKGGRKVLILELDLHKPRVYKALGMENDKPGITNILIGKDVPEKCVLKTSIENLDVILSGASPPNASELILSNHLNDILTFGKTNYDYVIIDTPPISLISDALVMMRISDVNIFVINTKYPYRESLNNAHEVVKNNKPKNFCFLLNGVRRNRSNYYYRRYGGAYGAYVSGYNDDKK